ncbi:MAG: tetratricopeptide repeat protein, partial [Taibaiella sp.]|nr:tetratricopeptide repeat protein [Taibaiella sp.]
MLHGITANRLYAQENEQAVLDSLKRGLRLAQDDTNKVKLLNTLCFKYHNHAPDSALAYGHAGLDLADKLGWEKGTAMIYNSLGSAHRIRSDYSEALDCFFKALEINERIGEKKGMAFNYGNIGIVYKTQEDYANALKYYKTALRTYE